jgi:hypothetical protein
VSTATTQATNAASSASSAATSATDSASSASTSASNASGASTSATNAGTSETNAATSASASANSASNAASSAASAASALDSFDDRYLGAKSSAPTLDNDGDALVTGALYYDTTETGMFVYDGSQWLVASSATQAILTVYNYTATSGQTTFSGVDDNTATLTYVSGSIIVTLNGIFLEDNADYTATSGTSVTLTTGANSNDELNVYAYNTFDSVNVYALGDTRYFQLSSTNEDISVNSITATGGTINGTSVGASTPSTGAFTSLSTSGVNNLAGLTASTALALDVSKNVVSVANTGTGSNVLNTSPTLVTPALGTPASGIMTNVTGTATALNIGGNAATATNASTVTTNADLTGAVTSVGNAASLGSFTSAQLATALTDETGTGANVFATSPTLVTPALGTPSSGVVTNLTGTASININGTVGASTPSTGAFTTLSATGTSTLAAVHTTGVMTMGSAAYWKAEVSTGFRFNNAADTVNLLIIPDNAPVTIAKGLAVTGAISSTTGANFATSSGNVGIGTSSPIGKLAVVGGAIQLSGGTSAQAGLRMQTVSGVADLSGINNDNNTFNPISISTNGTERLRVDSAGNVGIGTSSPFAKMNPAGATSTSNTAYSLSAPPTAGQLDVRSTDAYTTQLGGKITFSGISGTGEVALSVYGAIQGYKENATVSQAGGGLILSTTDNDSGTLNERARIDPSGNLLVGKTTSSVGTVGYHFQASGFGGQIFSLADTNEAFIYNNLSTAGSARVDFRVAGISKGNIQWNNTNVAYNTTSDYRLKEDWQPMIGASERVQALKPVNFAWKVDGSRVDGFLAHEAQEVVPECATGEKDAVDDEGKPNYQGIDQSKLVPLLTAALQEALTKIDSLTARIEALEGN